ncbi:MAG TPA: aconitase family protein, partial [Candidatus Krumholzibacteria bacterium]|nr:aconitase family protein [Candidatus Krumholzibacteria bacterium]
EIDVGDLVPTVACPHDIDQEAKVEEVAGRPVDQVFIGSCTNCRIEDLRIVKSIWEGHTLDPNTRVVITPASRSVYLQAMHEGLVEFFLNMGAAITNPGCGACLGRQGGVLDDDEVCVSTSNRNFKGRMGSPSAQIYLASPATAAACALTGVITDPRQYLPQTVRG